MGFNLGLGLRAANAYFKEGDAQKVRDQEQRRWDVENKKSEAGLSTLADQTEADRARFRLNAAQDSSAIGLQPWLRWQTPPLPLPSIAGHWPQR